MDTSVLVAGIAGVRSTNAIPKNASARLLRDWIEGDTFVWLVSDETLLEYKQVLGKAGRPACADREGYQPAAS